MSPIRLTLAAGTVAVLCGLPAAAKAGPPGVRSACGPTRPVFRPPVCDPAPPVCVPPPPVCDPGPISYYGGGFGDRLGGSGRSDYGSPAGSFDAGRFGYGAGYRAGRRFRSGFEDGVRDPAGRVPPGDGFGPGLGDGFAPGFAPGVDGFGGPNTAPALPSLGAPDAFDGVGGASYRGGFGRGFDPRGGYGYGGGYGNRGGLYDGFGGGFGADPRTFRSGTRGPDDRRPARTLEARRDTRFDRDPGRTAVREVSVRDLGRG